MKKLLVMTLLWSFFSIAQATTPKEISFLDLQGPIESYEDPFNNLTEDQFYNLSIYEEISETLKDDPSSVTKEIQKQADQAKAKLIEDKIDIEYMLEQSKRIAKIYEKSALSTNPLLANKKVEISGYMVVLELQGELVTEFLLVPTLGACSHKPIPAANQILLVKPEKPLEIGPLYQAVTIIGTLLLTTQQKGLYFVDGEKTIDMAYSMNSASVTSYNQ